MLTPAFRRWWVPPFMNWIPAWVPPNFITLASSACLWVALGLVATRHVWSPVTLGLALAVLSHGYLVYDQVDGMHAKKTGASSAASSCRRMQAVAGVCLTHDAVAARWCWH